MSFPVISGSDTTSNDSSPVNRLGSLHTDRDGNLYRYIQVEDAALADGDVVEFSDTSGYEVSNDRAGGASINGLVAGVAVATVSDGNYGYIMVSGRHDAVKTDGGVAQGDHLTPHATGDGQADTATTTDEESVFGFALETDDGTTSAGTAAAIIRCL